MDGDLGLVGDAGLQPAQHAGPAGQVDALVEHVAGQLRGDLGQGRDHRLDDLADRLGQGLADLGRGDLDRLGQPGGQLPAGDLDPRLPGWGQAEPTASLTCSAVRSPITTAYSRRMWVAMAASMSKPATRMALAATMPPSEMQATSVVPPPTSTTRWPVGSCTGRPAPMAAAIGSSSR